VTGNVDELTMVYGRYNELVFMGISSWFINITKLLVGGDWNILEPWNFRTFHKKLGIIIYNNHPK
jgi:hypothetical protein